jgi:histidinol-phosphatase (PHP family)
LIKSTGDFSEITANFYKEAQRLKEKYKNKIELLIGFESEWIRPSSHDIIKDLFTQYAFDIFIGSVHHVHTVPIDFDRTTYEKAREAAGGSDVKLFKDYFESQYEMLQALRPPIVGHFDLIRLLSDSPNVDMSILEDIWPLIQRNLGFIQSYKGILEINTSGWRKGMNEPYPARAICQVSSFLTV